MGIVTLLLGLIGLVVFVFALYALLVMLDFARQGAEYFARENARARQMAARYEERDRTVPAYREQQA